MSIKALKKILSREENDEADKNWDEWATIQNNSRKAVLECPHLSNELLNDYSPSNAYLLEKAYPTKQTRMALEEPTGLPPTEVGLIFLSAMIPHIICMCIIIWIALVGF
jgi:hypothetical protein